jgi:hypothetical protein
LDLFQHILYLKFELDLAQISQNSFHQLIIFSIIYWSIFNSFIFNEPYFLACDIPAFAKKGVANKAKVLDTSSGAKNPIMRDPEDMYKKGVIVRLDDA